MCMAKKDSSYCFLKDKLNLSRLSTQWDKKLSTFFEIISEHLLTWLQYLTKLGLFEDKQYFQNKLVPRKKNLLPDFGYANTLKIFQNYHCKVKHTFQHGFLVSAAVPQNKYNYVFPMALGRIIVMVLTLRLRFKCCRSTTGHQTKM